jgi:hypothetical protein
MSVVIYQRQQGAWMGDVEKPPYSDVDAEPLPAEPVRDGTGLAGRLITRLRSVLPIGEGAEGALR